MNSGFDKFNMEGDSSGGLVPENNTWSISNTGAVSYPQPYYDPRYDLTVQRKAYVARVEEQERERKHEQEKYHATDKAKHQEMIREVIENKRAKEYWDLEQDSDGTYVMVKKNTLIEPQRGVDGNFKSCSLNLLVSTSGESGYYRLRLIVKANDAPQNIYLKASEMGNPRYLIKKLNENGCRINTKNGKIRNDYVTLLVMKLKERLDRDEEIASNNGWVISGDTYRFVEKGELLWAEVEENAK